MDGEVGAQVSPPLFLQQGLPLGFHEAASLARKRDSAWQRISFHHDQQQQQSQPQLSGSGFSNSYGSWNPKLWDWDSTRFVATPAPTASERVLRPGAPSEVTGLELKSTGEKGHKVSEGQEEDLTLKLGGGPSTVEESVTRPSKRVRSGSPGNVGSYPMCQVDDCRADLSNAKDYHRRHKVCEVHSKTTKAMVGKHMQRFCQQCSRFHMLAEFDEGKRSCRRRLAGHNRRRRKTQSEDTSSIPVPPPSNLENSTSANLNLVNLLTILAQLQGNGLDKPSTSSFPDKDRLVQVLGKMNSLPNLASSPKAVDIDLNVSQTSQVSLEHPSKTDGNMQAPLTMDLLAVLSAALKAPAVNSVADFSQGSSESSGDERTRVHPEESVSDRKAQTKSPEFSSVAVGGNDCAHQSSTEISEHSVLEENNPSLRLQLLSSIEDESLPEMRSSSKYQYAESRNPVNNKSPSSSPDLWRLFPLQSEADCLKRNHISTIKDHNGMIGTSNKNEGRVSVLELSTHSERRVGNHTIQSVAYQAGYTSSSASDQSPSSSNSDSQERTGRIIFKLFGKDPNSFPRTLRTQILSWLSHSPSDMESYIRPGCVVLSVYLSMPSSAWDELQEDLLQRINLLVQHSDSDFWRNGRFLIYSDGQLASHKDGKIRLCRTWRTCRAPEIVSVSPLAVVSGRETPLVMRGRNLNVPGTKIHCTYMGGYVSKEVPVSSELGRIYDSSFKCFSFQGGSPNAFGRCFLEVENGFKGNSFPVIIADDKICQELRLLESEFDNDIQPSDVMQEDQIYDCVRRQSREDVLHFLNELGWLFQRSGIESYPLLENFSNARFKFLFIFSVERDWTSLIRKLLDILVDVSSRNVGLVQESLETLSEIQLLHRAVKRKCRKMVDLLLHYSVSNGIDSSKVYLFLPNIVGPGGVTPLHLAASMQDSEDIVDGLTADPQEIGLTCWTSVVDDNGQSPYTYALMGNNHSYNNLVSRKLVDRRNNQVSITVESEMDMKKPQSSREVERPQLESLETMCSRCAILERRRIKSALRPQGLLRYPFLNPILGIAAVCLCVCLFIRGAPETGHATPFMWENLDFGTS